MQSMSQEKITVNATIKAPRKKVWEYYTQPEHITKWNFASPTWHCPLASNDLKVGGRYFARMEAKDKSFGFDFEAVYTHIQVEENFIYQFAGRTVCVEFISLTDIQTEVRITFDPETENPIDMQRNGWQSIVDNFKNYAQASAGSESEQM